MEKVAAMTGPERADLFRETAGRMEVPPALVEKDFWVCWTLKRLFSIEPLRDNLMFKGGTSLSKIFGIINRFSEDIDLAVNYAPLGFTGDRDPAGPVSRNKREKLLEQMMKACQAYIAGPFLDAIQSSWGEKLGDRGPWALRVGVKNDPNTVEFVYPPAVGEPLSYVRPAVLLELGTHAEWIPSASYTVRPYAADHFPGVFADATCPVFAIRAERTFWEKATILHAEYHRPPDKPLPPRYSRHYYDMALLARSQVKDAALGNMDLLSRVVAHKTKFYAAAWARYELAVPGTLRLLPPEPRLDALRRDYEAMRMMVFGKPPDFERLLEAIAELEQTIREM